MRVSFEEVAFEMELECEQVRMEEGGYRQREEHSKDSGRTRVLWVICVDGPRKGFIWVKECFGTNIA